MAPTPNIFGFIRSKTTANFFAREHGNSERILDALLMVKLYIITTLLTATAKQKVSLDYEC